MGRHGRLRGAAVAALALASVTAAGVPVRAATTPLRGALFLASGEDPSVAAATRNGGRPAAGDARTTLLADGRDGVRVALVNLDPGRFPAGSSCQTEARAGSGTVKGAPLSPATVTGSSPATPSSVFDVTFPATVVSGSGVQVRLRCEFTGPLGRERHETQWTGSLA